MTESKATHNVWLKIYVNDLYEAIESRNVARIREILLDDPELSKFTMQDYSPLWHAALLGYEEIVEVLIEFGADPAQTCLRKNNRHRGFTFLQYMAVTEYSQSNCKVAEVFIRNGINVDATKKKIKAPLRLAVEKGNVKCAKFLLKNGASLEGPQWGGNSPAAHAFECIKDDSIRQNMLIFLLKHGLEANSCIDNRFSNSYGPCDVRGLAQILTDAGVPINNFQSRGDSSTFDFSGSLRQSALDWALLKCDFDLVSILIRRGANVDITGKHLFAAVRTKNPDIVALILLAGADVNAKNKLDGGTALHLACEYRHEKIINLLLLKGACVSLRDKKGNTPFQSVNKNFIELGGQDKEYAGTISALLRKFSVLTRENIAVDAGDMNWIRANQTYQEYFLMCVSELDLMESTKFYDSYSFYCVLRMSKNIKKLANLTRNEDFLKYFVENIQNFPYYLQDLVNIFMEAIQLRNRLEEVKERLISVFGDFLPDLVIEKLSENLIPEDLPL